MRRFRGTPARGGDVEIRISAIDEANTRVVPSAIIEAATTEGGSVLDPFTATRGAQAEAARLLRAGRSLFE